MTDIRAYARLPDWQDRFYRAIETRRYRTFKWGSHDCCLFAADVCLEITGLDFAAELRGRYQSVRSAAKLIQEYGGSMGALIDRLARKFGVPEIAPNMAHTGDVALANVDGQDVLAVVVDHRIAAAGEHGLTFRSRSLITRAWAI